MNLPGSEKVIGVRKRRKSFPTKVNKKVSVIQNNACVAAEIYYNTKFQNVFYELYL